jgi:hypothetical protein
MIKHGIKLISVIAALALQPAYAAPFGNADDVALAKTIWTAMQSVGLVGPNGSVGQPYVGGPPHGATLDTVELNLDVGGTQRLLSLKKNFGATDPKTVLENPYQSLGAVTIMVKMDDSYDPENQNWFYAKYLPSGELDQNPKGVALAGRVGQKGGAGCIGCHAVAPGGDYIFRHDRFKP